MIANFMFCPFYEVEQRSCDDFTQSLDWLNENGAADRPPVARSMQLPGRCAPAAIAPPSPGYSTSFQAAPCTGSAHDDPSDPLPPKRSHPLRSSPATDHLQ